MCGGEGRRVPIERINHVIGTSGGGAGIWLSKSTGGWPSAGAAASVGGGVAGWSTTALKWTPLTFISSTVTVTPSCWPPALSVQRVLAPTVPDRSCGQMTESGRFPTTWARWSATYFVLWNRTRTGMESERTPSQDD